MSEDPAMRLVERLMVDLFELSPRRIGSHVTLDALGLDSLDRAELALAIEEQVGRRVDDEDVADVVTVCAVVALVRARWPAARVDLGTGPPAEA